MTEDVRGEATHGADHDDAAQEDLRALRALPVLVSDERVAVRHQKEARATFVRRFEAGSGSMHILEGGAGRAALPVVLASLVGIYVTWALSTAFALM